MTGRHRRENPDIVLGCLRPRFLGAALVLAPLALWSHRFEWSALWRDLDSRSGGDLQSSPVGTSGRTSPPDRAFLFGVWVMGIVKTAAEILAEIGDEEADERPPLTFIQQELLDAIVEFTRRHGFAPMLDELAEILDAPRSTLGTRVKTLRARGYIEGGGRQGQRRRLRVVDRPAERIEAPQRVDPPCPAAEHTFQAYTAGSCRCALGRAANAAYTRQRRAADRAAYYESLGSSEPYIPNITHGLNGYRKHGCRCTTCRRAHELEPLNRAERVA